MREFSFEKKLRKSHSLRRCASKKLKHKQPTVKINKASWKIKEILTSTRAWEGNMLITTGFKINRPKIRKNYNWKPDMMPRGGWKERFLGYDVQ